MIILLKSGTKINPDFYKENLKNKHTKPYTIENKIIIPFIFGLTAHPCTNTSI